MAGDAPPRHHPGSTLFGHRGSSGRSLLRTLTSLAKKRTKLPSSAPSAPPAPILRTSPTTAADRPEFVPGTAAVSSLAPDTYEARGLHETQVTQLPSTTSTDTDAPDPEAPLSVHVAIRFPGRRPCPLPTYTHTYSSSRCLDPSDRLCQGLVQRLEHCSTEFITRKDSSALDPLKSSTPQHRSAKPLRYSIRFRVTRHNGGVWAEKIYRSYQAHELTSQDARDLILATHRMVALFLSRHDPSFSWTDLPATSEMQFAVAFGLPSPPSLPERVRPVVGEPLPLACVPKVSPTDPESPSAAPLPGYSISFTFRSRCPSRRRDWKRLVFLQSTQGTPLTLALAEELFGQTSAAITSALATRQASLLQEHRACDAIDGVATTCQHFAEDAVDIELRVENNLGPDYDHLHRSIRSKLVLFRHPDGHDCRQFLHDVRSRLVQARDAADRGLTNLPDFDLRILTLCGPGWSVDNPARFVLDAGPTAHTRHTVEAVLDRVLTGIANVVGGKTYTLQLAAYKRGHLILDKVLLGRAAPANPWLRPSSPGEQTDVLVARLRDRIQQDIAAVCKDTCRLDGIAEVPVREAEPAEQAVALVAEPVSEPTALDEAAAETTVPIQPAAPRVVELPEDVFFDALESRPSSSATSISLRRRAFPLMPEKFTLPHARSPSVDTTRTTGTAVTAFTSFSQPDASVDDSAAPPTSVEPAAEAPVVAVAAPPPPIPDFVQSRPMSEAFPTIEPILEQQETDERSVQESSPAPEALELQPQQADEEEAELEHQREPEPELALESVAEEPVAQSLSVAEVVEPVVVAVEEPAAEHAEEPVAESAPVAEIAETVADLAEEAMAEPTAEPVPVAEVAALVAEPRPAAEVAESVAKPTEEPLLEPAEEELMEPLAELEQQPNPKPEPLLEAEHQPAEQQSEPGFLQLTESILESEPEAEAGAELQQTTGLEQLPDALSRDGSDVVHDEEPVVAQDHRDLEEQDIVSDAQLETTSLVQGASEEMFCSAPAADRLDDMPPVAEVPVSSEDRTLDEPAPVSYDDDLTAPLTPSSDAHDDTFIADTTAITTGSSNASRPSTPCHSVHSGTYDSPNSSFLDDENLAQRKEKDLEGDAGSHHSQEHDAEFDVDARDFTPTPTPAMDSDSTAKELTPVSRAPVCFSFVSDSESDFEGEAEGDALHSDTFAGKPEVFEDFAMSKPAIDLDDDDVATTPAAVTETTTRDLDKENVHDQSSGNTLQFTHTAEYPTTSLSAFFDFSDSDDTDDTELVFPDYGHLSLHSQPVASASDKQHLGTNALPDISAIPELRLTQVHDITAKDIVQTCEPPEFPEVFVTSELSDMSARLQPSESPELLDFAPSGIEVPLLRVESPDTVEAAISMDSMGPEPICEPQLIAPTTELEGLDVFIEDATVGVAEPEAVELESTAEPEVAAASVAVETEVAVELEGAVESEVASELEAAEPMVVEPVVFEPVVLEPVAIEAEAAADPEPEAIAELEAAVPVVVEPVVVEPVAVEPAVAVSEVSVPEAAQPDAALFDSEPPVTEDGKLSSDVTTRAFQESIATLAIDDAKLESTTPDKSLPRELQEEQDLPLFEEVAHDNPSNFDATTEAIPACVECEEDPAPEGDSTREEPETPSVDLVSVQTAPDLSVTEALPAVQDPETQLPPEVIEEEPSQPPTAEDATKAEVLEAALQTVVSDPGPAVEPSSPKAVLAPVVVRKALALDSEAPFARNYGTAMAWDCGATIGKELVRGSIATAGRLFVPQYPVAVLDPVSAERSAPWSLPTAGYLGLPKRNIAAVGLRDALVGLHASDATLHGPAEERASGTTTPPEGTEPEQPTDNKTSPASDESAAATQPTVATSSAVVPGPAKATGAPVAEEQVVVTRDLSALPRLIFAFVSLAVFSQMVRKP